MLESQKIIFSSSDIERLSEEVKKVIEVDPSISLEVYKDCLLKVLEVASPKAVFVKTNVSVKDDMVTIFDKSFLSKTLKMHLKDCKYCYLVAVTIGAKIDRLINRYAKLSAAKSYVVDKIASIYVEAVLKLVSRQIGDMEKGKYLATSYSAGYGDFMLGNQGFFIDVLKADKKIGLTMTSGYMLAPTKSITAIIGIADIRQPDSYPCDGCNRNCKGGLCTK